MRISNPHSSNQRTTSSLTISNFSGASGCRNDAWGKIPGWTVRLFSVSLINQNGSGRDVCRCRCRCWELRTPSSEKRQKSRKIIEFFATEGREIDETVVWYIRNECKLIVEIIDKWSCFFFVFFQPPTGVGSLSTFPAADVPPTSGSNFASFVN